MSGAFRSNAGAGLDSWHYADIYTDTPVYSREWMIETPVNVDRTLAVSAEVGPQFLCDWYFDAVYTRVMPLYSIPGLLGHM